MYIKRGFNAETKIISSVIHCVSNLLLTRANAEGLPIDEGGQGTATPPAVNFENLIEKARKEEKDKLYPRIKKLEEENKTLVATGNSNLIKIAELQNENESLKKKLESGESEKIKELEDKLEIANNEIKTLKESTPDEKSIREQVEKEYEIKLYRNTALTENKDSILSVFADEVKGNTKEEIDTALEEAKKKTIELKKEMGVLDKDGNPIITKKKEKDDDDSGEKKTTKKVPTANPTSFADNEDKIDFEYVQSLDPSSDEYKEFRKKLGLK